MAAEAKLLASLADAEAALFEQTRVAEAARARESGAALVIESNFRSWVVRKNLAEFHARALQIQAYYRGHLGRKRAWNRAHALARDLRERFFARAAVVIQRHWRGYWSRKHVHSFGARKAYLRAVEKASEALRAELDAHHAAQLEQQQLQLEEEAYYKFADTIKGLHHLVSTESCQGIYNSPFAVVTGGPPMVAGKAVEEHLRDVRKGALAEQPPAQWRNSPVLANPKGSIQAASPFDAMEEQRKQDLLMHKVATMGARPFIAGSKTSLPPPVPSVRASTPYQHYDLADSKKAEQTQKAKLISAKPFVT
mmetsp:Transcript_15183/g.49819  ORF Transcript_15183/g.49819 Transcript_15183/m.49819 type:complete len:309 (+) Transcript_15183:52-978(+)